MRARPAVALCAGLLFAAGAARASGGRDDQARYHRQLVGPDAHHAALELQGYIDFVRRSTFSADESALGAQLFFDARLSKNRKMSCSTCHKPELNWTDGLPRARGKDNQELERNTMSLLTARYSKTFFWDGRAVSLEDASLQAVQNTREMDQTLPDMVARLRQIPGYRAQFDRLYGGVTSERVGRALAAFILSIPVAEDSRFDEFLKTGKGLDDQELRGWLVFSGAGNCRTCHFSNRQYHNIGLKSRDLGRYLIDPRLDEWRAFRVPSLRNVARTAPYMHDGSLATLKDVVDFYDRGGDEKRYVDANIRPLYLTAQQKEDLIAFLNALTSTAGRVTPPALPPDD